MLVFEEDNQVEAEPNDGIMRLASGSQAVPQRVSKPGKKS